MNRAVRFLKDCGTFYLATVDGDFARVRPFGAIAEFEGKTYICTNSEKDVYRQMIKNPNVEISATAEDGSWIRITGQAVVDNRDEAKQAMFAEYPNLREMYAGREKLYQVLYIKNAKAAIYTFTGEPERFEL